MNGDPARALAQTTVGFGAQRHPGRPQLRLGLAEPVLEQRVRHQSAFGEGRGLVEGEREDVVQGPSGHADGHARDLEGGPGQLGDPQRWHVDRRLAAEDDEAALVGDERPVDHDVVAAGAAQPGHRPGVLDLDVARGEHHHADRRLPAVVDHAVADEPVGVLAAAGERPLPGHPVAALDRGGGAGRVGRGGHDHVGAGGVERVEAGSGEHPEQDGTLRPDHHRPGHRGVRAGQLLEDLQLGGQVQLGAAVAAGHQHPEAARGDQLVHQVGG